MRVLRLVISCAVIMACATVMALVSRAIAATPPLINFQGLLSDSSGAPLSGSHTVTFSMYDAESGPNLPLWVEQRSITTDAKGRFNVLLGSVTALTDALFSGPDRWLGVAVSPDPELVPRTRIVSVAYAERISTLDGASGGTITSKVSIGPGHTNTGTNAFVAGENNTASGDWSTIGGGFFNRARGDFSVVAGGGGPGAIDSNVASGEHTTIGGGSGNIADGTHSTVSGGWNNRASVGESFVGGGTYNSATNPYATVGGGGGNHAASEGSVVAGGSSNIAIGFMSAVTGGYKNFAWGSRSFIGGGAYNASLGLGSVVVGGGGVAGLSGTPGDSNLALGDYSFVGGGRRNMAIGAHATVSGGDQNVASGDYATVAGGSQNAAAGNNSFAAGTRAKANYAGSFVWADNQDQDLSTTNENQFLVRATGNVGINTNTPCATLSVNGSVATSVTTTSGNLTITDAKTYSVILAAPPPSTTLTITLPSAACLGVELTIKIICACGNVTVLPTSPDQVDGSTSLNMNGPYEAVVLVSGLDAGGSPQWWVVARK